MMRNPKVALILFLSITLFAVPGWTAENPAPSENPKVAQATTSEQPQGDMEVLKLELPKPIFAGTPKGSPPGMDVEIRKGPRKPVMVPKGLKNVAAGKKVTSSDMVPIIGEVKMITDGDKEGIMGSYVELGPGLQWVQIDLGKVYELHALVVWHYHQDPRVFKGVVIQTADDEDFIEGVVTHFNNDKANETGLGIGKDKQYFENYEGKLVMLNGVKSRYVRLYSMGSTGDDQNQYVEVEVYGK